MYNLNRLASSCWGASLVPAAAVIPAPKAYPKVAAVKKFVVSTHRYPSESLVAIKTDKEGYIWMSF